VIKTATITVRLQEWVGWIAQDSNGTWYQFESKPITYEVENKLYWGRKDSDDVNSGVMFIAHGVTNPEWKTTLQEIKGV